MRSAHLPDIIHFGCAPDLLIRDVCMKGCVWVDETCTVCCEAKVFFQIHALCNRLSLAQG